MLEGACRPLGTEAPAFRPVRKCLPGTSAAPTLPRPCPGTESYRHAIIGPWSNDTPRAPRPPPSPRPRWLATGRAPIQRTGSGSTWSGYLVWIPKYRKRVLNGPVAARLTGLLRQACEVNAWGLVELNVQPDHVHMLLQVPPTASVSRVMQSLKGGTARVLRAEFPQLEEFLWGESFWGDGYFAETVGQTEEAVVRAYITPLKPPQPAASGADEGGQAEATASGLIDRGAMKIGNLPFIDLVKAPALRPGFFTRLFTRSSARARPATASNTGRRPSVPASPWPGRRSRRRCCCPSSTG